MKLSTELLKECKFRLSAEVPNTVVDVKKKEITSMYLNYAKLPGFRPGKTPVSIIQKKYKSSIDKELIEHLTRSIFVELKNKKGINVLSVSSIEREEFDPQGSFLYAIEAIREPDFKLDNYKGIKVEVPAIEVNDDIVTEFLKSIQKRNAPMKSVDRKSKVGDVIVLDYETNFDISELDDKKKKDLSTVIKGEDIKFEILDDDNIDTMREYLPGLTKASIGLSKGQLHKFESSFSYDFPINLIAGKTLSYDIKVKNVEEYELKEIDEEFAKFCGAQSLEELKKMAESQIKQEQLKSRNKSISNQIINYIIDKTPFEIPEHIVKSETQRQVDSMAFRGYEMGIKEEDIKLNQKDLFKYANNKAKKDIRTYFILNKIAEKENLEVSKEEIDSHVYRVAMEQNRPIKKVLAEVKKSGSARDIESNIRSQKAMQFIIDNADIKELENEKN